MLPSKALPDPGPDIRVLVTSRPEKSSSNELGDVEFIEVNKSSNHADILAYVGDSLRNLKGLRHPRLLKDQTGVQM